MHITHTLSKTIQASELVVTVGRAYLEAGFNQFWFWTTVHDAGVYVCVDDNKLGSMYIENRLNEWISSWQHMNVARQIYLLDAHPQDTIEHADRQADEHIAREADTNDERNAAIEQLL